MAKKLDLECIVCGKGLKPVEDDLIFLCARCLKEYEEWLPVHNAKLIAYGFPDKVLSFKEISSASIWAYLVKGLSQEAFSIRFERNLKKFFESKGKHITFIDRGRIS